MKKVSTEFPEQEPMDPRVRRTRQLLGDAFRSLMAERQFAQISVQDITERATVNRATFYAHYTSKEELGASVIQEDLLCALADKFSACPTFSAEDLTKMAVAIFEFVGKLSPQCAIHAAQLHSNVGQALQQGIYELVLGWLSRSSGYKQRFPGTPKETIATVLAWGLYGGALKWSSSTRRPPAEQACQEIVAMFFR
ncbi:MAG: TetR/AcrR family transcriptional regulator [Armatimonas sp.]